MLDHRVPTLLGRHCSDTSCMCFARQRTPLGIRIAGLSLTHRAAEGLDSRRPAHPVGEALEEGVGEDEAQGGGPQHDAVRVQLQQNGQSQQQLPAQQPCQSWEHAGHDPSRVRAAPCRGAAVLLRQAGVIRHQLQQLALAVLMQSVHSASSVTDIVSLQRTAPSAAVLVMAPEASGRLAVRATFVSRSASHRSLTVHLVDTQEPGIRCETRIVCVGPSRASAASGGAGCQVCPCPDCARQG